MALNENLAWLHICLIEVSNPAKFHAFIKEKNKFVP